MINANFYFCDKCGKRFFEAERFTIQGQEQSAGVLCKPCGAILQASPTKAVTPVEKRQQSEQKKPLVSESSKKERERQPAATTAIVPASPQPNRNLIPVIAGVCVGLLILGFIIFRGKNGGKEVAQAQGAGNAETHQEPPKPVSEKNVELGEGAVTPKAHKPENPEKTNEVASGPSKPPVVEPSRPLNSNPAPVTNPTPVVNTNSVKVPEPVKPTPPANPKPPVVVPPPNAKKTEEVTIIHVETIETESPMAKYENAMRLFLNVAKQSNVMLAENKFTEALDLLERKRKDPTLADAAELLKQEHADIGAVLELRKAAFEELRKKVGETVSLKKGNLVMKGKVLAEPKPDLLSVNMGGPEMSFRYEQLSVDDVDQYAPRMGTEGEDLRRKALLYLYAGQTAKAKTIFTKPQTQNAKPYLDRLAAMELGEVEASALRGWDGAEKMFTLGDWKGALAAYQEFFKRYEKTKTAATKLNAYMERIVAIDQKLNPAPTLILDLSSGVKLELVYIRPGTFMMGGNDDPKNGVQGIEKPRHTVRITKGFYLGKYEVTNTQYKEITGKGHGHWPNTAEEPNRPIDGVTHNDALEFCRQASAKTKKTIRLPTEAEWEYACRAGSETEWSNCTSEAALNELSWFGTEGKGWTHSVGQKKPNAWGLYDMHGNAREWVADWYAVDYYASSQAGWDPSGPETGTHRIRRGGGTSFSGAYDARCATRHFVPPESAGADAGFRVALTPP